MQTDRATKVLLALIAAGLWIPVLSQLDISEARATSAPVVASSEADWLASDETGSGPLPPASALPLRWRVAQLSEMEGVGGGSCMTFIKVQNLSGSSVSVDVEMYGFGGSFLENISASVSTSGTGWWATDDVIKPEPFKVDHSADLANFYGGYAKVFADDPRILVSAYHLCRTGTGPSSELISIDSIPSYATGASMEFFQAGMPTMAGDPSVAGPEPTGERR